MYSYNYNLSVTDVANHIHTVIFYPELFVTMYDLYVHMYIILYIVALYVIIMIF